MNPLELFPYKNMKKIADLLSEGRAPVSNIQKATGHCYFDSTEVSDMLSHLTSYGKVLHEDDRWLIAKPASKTQYGPFRERFLADAEDILKTLSTTPSTMEDIAKRAKKSVETVRLYLPFLEQVTKHGLIGRGPELVGLCWELKG